MSESKLLAAAFAYFRSRRMRAFERTFSITAETRVLDVGGSPRIWNYVSVRPKITVLNLPTGFERSAFDFVSADGCALPFRNNSFDIVFSNSVIEHVGSAENQRLFATEAARVGRGYWIQTPDRRAPFEMHTMLPYVHRLPERWRSPIIRRFSPWQWITRATPRQKEYFFGQVMNELRLLNPAELRTMFPDGRVLEERFLGFPKSLVAFRPLA